MIIRHWAGRLKPEETENYLSYLKDSLFPKLLQLKGYAGSSVQRRNVEGAVEFLVITKWHTLNDIEAFAGSDYTVAVVSEKAQRMMVDFDEKVIHFEEVDLT